MKSSDIQEFIDLFLNGRPPVSVRQATVQTTLTSPNRVRIRLGGQPPDIDARYLASYSPTIGDTVWALVNQRDIIVMGKLA